MLRNTQSPKVIFHDETPLVTSHMNPYKIVGLVLSWPAKSAINNLEEVEGSALGSWDPNNLEFEVLASRRKAVSSVEGRGTSLNPLRVPYRHWRPLTKNDHATKVDNYCLGKSQGCHTRAKGGRWARFWGFRRPQSNGSFSVAEVPLAEGLTIPHRAIFAGPPSKNLLI
jgi:hypothetical protein